jgi:hypothetical protein
LGPEQVEPLKLYGLQCAAPQLELLVHCSAQNWFPLESVTQQYDPVHDVSAPWQP